MYQETPEDMDLKYHDCYLHHKDLGVIKLQEFGCDVFDPKLLKSKGLRYPTPSSKGVSIEVDLNFEDGKLDDGYPMVGWINTKSSAYFVKRLNNPGSPYKYRKSISEYSVEIYDIRESLSLQTYFGNPKVKASAKTVIVSLFNRAFPSIKEAYQKIISGKRQALAIHPDYCLVIDIGLDEIVVMYKLMPVGFAHPQGLIILWPSTSYLYEDIQSKLGIEVCF